jgi:hypothetical protein
VVIGPTKIVGPIVVVVSLTVAFVDKNLASVFSNLFRKIRTSLFLKRRIIAIIIKTKNMRMKMFPKGFTICC